VVVARALLCVLAAGAVGAGALAAFTACDQSGSLVPTGEGGAGDASAAPDATTEDGPGTTDGGDGGAVEEPQTADVCGDGPWVTLGIVVVALDLGNLDGSTPLPGATFTSPLCPGLEKTSDEAGAIVGLVSKGVPFYGRLQAKNYVSELAPEEIFDADSTGNKIEMLPSILEDFLPGFDGGSTAIVIAAEKLQNDAGACSSLDGITFGVPGHPEANVYYFSAGGIPTVEPDASATSTRGLVAITGLAAGQFVTLAGSKTGCTVLFVHGPLTGRVPLENGFASLMPAYLSP
jgi:hypothetical protein